jgi:hypothetical protein
MLGLPIAGAVLDGGVTPAEKPPERLPGSEADGAGTGGIVTVGVQLCQGTISLDLNVVTVP